jgi:hypothetical protein
MCVDAGDLEMKHLEEFPSILGARWSDDGAICLIRAASLMIDGRVISGSSRVPDSKL